MTDNKGPFVITSEDVVNGIYKLAQAKPGVYERQDGASTGCVNVERDADGKAVPSCIVGSYLADRIGIENVPTSGSSTFVLNHLVEEGLVTVTPMARFLLGQAQAYQDTRKVPWSTIADTLTEVRYVALRLIEESTEA